MLYEFQKKNNATKATENICSVYGENALNVRTCQFWFKRFREGNFDLSDNPRSGRPSTIDNEKNAITFYPTQYLYREKP